MRIDTKGDTWTYGAEHELADWDTKIKLPDGFARSPDYTIVNSNGIAAQPNPEYYRYGGEINTPPSDDIEPQCVYLEKVQELLECEVNHRSNLHIHIRVPGLIGSLPVLKKVQKYIHDELPRVISLIEPIPKGNTQAEKKRARRRKVSHHTFLTAKRLNHQLQAGSIEEFFEREVPLSKSGAVMWHAQARVCVNLRQLKQTDTVEFRHFPGTLNSDELKVCLEWCRDFMVASLNDLPLLTLYKTKYEKLKFPVFPPFDYEREVRYQATASHGELNQKQINENIKLILEGKFSGSEAERIAAERAGSMSR